MNDERLTALLELDARQSARARLFLHLNLLTDLDDVAGFVDTLADVATARSRTGPAERARPWARLAEALEGVLKPGQGPARRRAAARTSAPGGRTAKATRGRGVGERRPKFD